jgi:GntR family transcriptional repressor for pyruvate dehydrogenase complex
MGDGKELSALNMAPIRTQKVHIVAANRILREIKAGTWKPGSRLPSERELSEILAISRTSVRQALTTLEALGIVHSKRGAGSFVDIGADKLAGAEVADSLLQEGDPQSLLEARNIIEPETARLAAANRQRDDIERLKEILCRMAAEESADSMSRYLDADYYFHMVLAYATHNPVIIDMTRVIVERMKAPPWRNASLAVAPVSFTVNLAEHTRIVEAVRARAPNKAREAMTCHLRGVARRLKKISSGGA